MLKRLPKPAILTSVAMLACLLLPVNAMAMRCGTKLISNGDIQAKVLKYCGKPVQTSQRYGLRTAFYAGTRLSYNGSSVINTGTKYYSPYGHYEVLVEDWIFNLGPNRLMRIITFENGIVVDVDTLGYGYID